MTPLRKSFRCPAVSSSGTAVSPWSRATLAAWMRATGDLAGPDRVRVGLRGVLDVSQQVGGAQLVADVGKVIVVDVPVVDDDGPMQVAVDEALERGQRPLAEEVIGEQAGAGDLQVLLVRLGARASAQRCLVAEMTRASKISARIALFAAATARALRASRACTHPLDGRVPDIDSMMSAQRSTGTWCITIKNTHQAWKLTP